MKVKILVPLSGEGFSYAIGDTPDVKDAKEASRWIKAGFAERAVDPKAGVETRVAKPRTRR
jgi:hypothetical protein